MGNYNVQKTACQSSKKVFEKNSIWPWKCTMHLKVFENYEKCLILQDRPNIDMFSFCMYVHQKSIIREEKKDYKSPWHRITQPLSA